MFHRDPKTGRFAKCPHYQDNQGLCHCCGIIMDIGMWEDYLGRPLNEQEMVEYNNQKY